MDVVYIILGIIVILIILFCLSNNRQNFMYLGAIAKYKNDYAYCMNLCERDDRRERISSDNTYCQNYCDSAFNFLSRNNLQVPDGWKNPIDNMSTSRAKEYLDDETCRDNCRVSWNPKSDEIRQDCYDDCKRIRRENMPNRINLMY